MGAVTDVSFPPRPEKHRVHGALLAVHVHRRALRRDAHPARDSVSARMGMKARDLLERAHEVPLLMLPPDDGNERGRDEAVHAHRDMVMHRGIRVRDHRVEAMLMEREQQRLRRGR